MEAKFQFHSQIETTAERSSREGSLTLNSWLNSLQCFSEDFGCHSQEVIVFTSVPLLKSRHELVKMAHLAAWRSLHSIMSRLPASLNEVLNQNGIHS